MWKRLLFLLLFLAACSNAETTDETPPTDDAVIAVDGEGQERVEVTLESPPEWQEASAVLGVNNIAQATYIGRLDTQFGEISTVFAHSFSPDATQLAVLDNNNLIVWDLISGEMLFNASRRGATSVFFSSDKSEIYTVDPGGNVLIYDTVRGIPSNDLRGHTASSGTMSFNADDDLLVLGGTDSTVKVWDLVERTSIVTFDSSAGDITAVAMSDDATLVGVGGTNATIEIWDWRERVMLSLFPANVTEIERIVFSPDNAYMAVTTPEVILVFDLTTYDALYAIELGAGSARDVFMFSPNSRYLVTAGTTDDMLIWDSTDGALLATLPGMNGQQSSAAFSPDSALMLTSVRGGEVSLWNMDSLSESGIANAPLEVPSDRIFNVAWSPDGFLMLFFDELGPLYLWGLPASDA